MKTRHLISTSMVVVSIMTAALWLVHRSQPAERHSTSGTDRSPISEIRVDRKSITTLPAVATAPSQHQESPADAVGESAKTVHVRPERALVVVNGVAITLKDLVPQNAAQTGAEQTMSPEMYDFLLNRAIERELAFQAAHVQGVELTAEQQQQLTQMRAALEKPDPAVVRQLTIDAARVEFDIRDATGLMLQVNLMARTGAPTPHVTPGQVEQYYQSHKAEFGELPADPAQRQTAWQQINLQIRQKLAPELQAEYQGRLRQMINQLKTAANIALTG